MCVICMLIRSLSNLAGALPKSLTVVSVLAESINVVVIFESVDRMNP